MTAEDRFAPINDGCRVFWSWLWPLIRIWTALIFMNHYLTQKTVLDLYASKSKVFIKHMNVLEWFGYRCDCADEYNPTHCYESPTYCYATYPTYCFESNGSKNDCSRSILTLKKLLVWLYLEEGRVRLWMWLLRSDFASKFAFIYWATYNTSIQIYYTSSLKYSLITKF